jgi:hypothetical protein
MGKLGELDGIGAVGARDGAVGGAKVDTDGMDETDYSILRDPLSELRWLGQAEACPTWGMIHLATARPFAVTRFSVHLPARWKRHAWPE